MMKDEARKIAAVQKAMNLVSEAVKKSPQPRFIWLDGNLHRRCDVCSEWLLLHEDEEIQTICMHCQAVYDSDGNRCADD